MSVPTAAVPTTHIERPITHCVLQMDARTEMSANTGKLVVGVNLILRWRTEACVKVSKRNVQPHKGSIRPGYTDDFCMPHNSMQFLSR